MQIVEKLIKLLKADRLFDFDVSFQGDVGCGKTVVAFLACMEVIGSGYQVDLV